MDKKALARQFQYLDDLRESGITNMFGAAPYLARACNLKIERAREVLSVWMKSDLELPPEERAAKAIRKMASHG